MQLITVITLFASLTVSYAAIVRGRVPCPDGHKDGDVLYLPNCVRFICRSTEYTYESCGALGYDKTTCYSVKTNATANYPECCKAKLYCLGDADFDPAYLDYPAQ
ncbi:uncharacterized protein LOC106070193 [Biomphalaria glabrata]|uniref:Uncharacterized protein LOC106070193 n=1 Tax=Biomphalaria glabrata TaxID=6526 RepID=A0A9W3AGK3_BIOGL|nr:uncharacterized protein LOC106070193 [Biomphalaria glabrata]